MHKQLTIFCIVTLLTFVGCTPQPQQDTEAERATIVFMPWSGNLTQYLFQNVRDLAAAVAAGDLGENRLIVCLMSSKDKGAVFELKQTGKGFRADTLQVLSSPDFSDQTQLADLFVFCKQHARARQYQLIIGSHGTAWLPHDITPQGRTARKSPQWFGAMDEGYRIDITTLAEAMQEAELYTEYILFDDCFMSSVEVAYALRHSTNHLIGCPTEILSAGFPYKQCARLLLQTPDYQAICDTFVSFYQTQAIPCGTIAVTDCRRLERLATCMGNCETGELVKEDIQILDGYEPHIFYDLGDWIEHLEADDAAKQEAILALHEAVVAKAATTQFYSAYTGYNALLHFSGLNTSAPAAEPYHEAWLQTEWGKL